MQLVNLNSGQRSKALERLTTQTPKDITNKILTTLSSIISYEEKLNRDYSIHSYNLVGDNTDQPENVYIIHTEYPSFVIDLDTDDVEWLDQIEGEDETELTDEMNRLLSEANTFYMREVDRYESMD